MLAMKTKPRRVETSTNHAFREEMCLVSQQAMCTKSLQFFAYRVKGVGPLQLQLDGLPRLRDWPVAPPSHPDLPEASSLDNAVDLVKEFLPDME